jgi:hypothetical protein
MVLGRHYFEACNGYLLRQFDLIEGYIKHQIAMFYDISIWLVIYNQSLCLRKNVNFINFRERAQRRMRVPEKIVFQRRKLLNS